MRSVRALAVEEFNRDFSPTSNFRVAVAYILLQRSKRRKAFATASISRLFRNQYESIALVTMPPLIVRLAIRYE